jgi:hypothetical protein
MIGRLLVMAGVAGMAGVGVGLARLARQDRRPVGGAVAAEAVTLADIARDGAGVLVTIETELPTPGSSIAARCWLTDASGASYQPRGVLRQSDEAPVRETHRFAVPTTATGLRLHLSAGPDEPVLTAPVPAPVSAPAHAPLRLIA